MPLFNWYESLIARARAGRKVFKAPAVRVGGKVYEAPGKRTTHWDAIKKAQKDWSDEDIEMALQEGSAPGYTTKKGDFIPGDVVRRHFPGTFGESGALRKAGLMNLIPPAAAFGTGMLRGVGLPTPQDVREAGEYQAQFTRPHPLGELLTRMIPTEETLKMLLEALTHPAETGRVLAQSARENPAGALGFSMGMAVPGWLGRIRNLGLTGERAARFAETLPFPGHAPGEYTEYSRALKYGGEQLTEAERRFRAGETRVLRERARVHRELEGPQGPLPAIKVGEASNLERITGMPDKTLISAHKFSRTQPGYEQHTKMLEAEMARRGLKSDISDEISMMEEGPRAPLSAGVMIRKQGPPERPFFSTESVPMRDPVGGYQEVVPLPRVATQADIGGEILGKAGVQMPASQSMAQIKAGALELPNIRRAIGPVPKGETIAWAGERFMNTPKGWTLVGGNPTPKDYEWVWRRNFDLSPPPKQSLGGLMENIPPIRESNIEHAVETIHMHGGFALQPTDRAARAIVARKILERAKAGQATTQEIAWLNVWGARMFGKGFRWGRKQ